MSEELKELKKEHENLKRLFKAFLDFTPEGREFIKLNRKQLERWNWWDYVIGS